MHYDIAAFNLGSKELAAALAAGWEPFAAVGGPVPVQTLAGRGAGMMVVVLLRRPAPVEHSDD